MNKYSEDYYHRKCFLERKQVPTQTIMKNKMHALAPVYFKSMTPKLKVVAGLEPPLKGGGSEWFQNPNKVLEGRAVLESVKKSRLTKLGFNGIAHFGEDIVKAHNLAMERAKEDALIEDDNRWKAKILATCNKQFNETSRVEAIRNTENILLAMEEFTTLYATSITNIQDTIMDAAIKQIKSVQQGTYHMMLEKHKHLVERQATELYYKYAQMLDDTKAKAKAEFKTDVDVLRKDLAIQLHDINVDKHIAVEKLRNLLECQNLAAQVYVALKEKEEYNKYLELSKYEHKKNIKQLKEQLAMRDFELQLELEKEKKRQILNKGWKKKICHIVKKFQMFVEYCLHLLPEHVDFFINMEKLMLLQLSEASKNPKAENLFEPEPEPEFHTPVPKPHPMYLFREYGYKTDIDPKLCPKHCTSSASQLPVVVLNKRCIYPACDNIELFTEKVARYLRGDRGDDEDVADDHDYQYDIPVKYNLSQQHLDVKMESSMMQILQKDLPNLKKVPFECGYCKTPYCFCNPLIKEDVKAPSEVIIMKEPSLHSLPSGTKIETRSIELEHEREPKWESYMRYVKPNTCECAKTAQKHFEERLPPYMRIMSKYDHPELLNYQICPLGTLRSLVREAKGKRSPPPPPVKIPSATRTVATQYEDEVYNALCNCFSESELPKMFEKLVNNAAMLKPALAPLPLMDQSERFVSDMPQLKVTASTFATQRAFSLRNLLDNETELKEIFKKSDCVFD